MNQDRLAISNRLALKMFWDAGFDTEELLQAANKILNSIEQPTQGYFYADDVVNSVQSSRKCPYPINNDDGTALMCVSNGHCGCDESNIINGAQSCQLNPNAEALALIPALSPRAQMARQARLLLCAYVMLIGRNSSRSGASNGSGMCWLIYVRFESHPSRLPSRLGAQPQDVGVEVVTMLTHVISWLSNWNIGGSFHSPASADFQPAIDRQLGELSRYR